MPVATGGGTDVDPHWDEGAKEQSSKNLALYWIFLPVGLLEASQQHESDFCSLSCPYPVGSKSSRKGGSGMAAHERLSDGLHDTSALEILQAPKNFICEKAFYDYGKGSPERTFG